MDERIERLVRKRIKLHYVCVVEINGAFIIYTIERRKVGKDEAREMFKQEVRRLTVRKRRKSRVYYAM